MSDEPFNAIVCRAGPCATAAAPLLRGLDATRLEPRLRLPAYGIR